MRALSVFESKLRWQERGDKSKNAKLPIFYLFPGPGTVLIPYMEPAGQAAEVSRHGPGYVLCLQYHASFPFLPFPPLLKCHIFSFFLPIVHLNNNTKKSPLWSLTTSLCVFTGFNFLCSIPYQHMIHLFASLCIIWPLFPPPRILIPWEQGWCFLPEHVALLHGLPGVADEEPVIPREKTVGFRWRNRRVSNQGRFRSCSKVLNVAK